MAHDRLAGFDPCSDASRHDRVTEGAQPLDAQDHLVARFEIAAERLVADLEQAAGADRPAADQVARPQVDIGGGRASISPNENCASDQRPRLVSVPLTSAVIARS